MKEAKRALILCAHDDDEVIGPGGTIRKLVSAGVEVTTVVFATGNEGYIHLEERTTIVERRKQERAAAQEILGTAHCIAHDYGDFENLDREAVYREVIRSVRTARPHLVLTHLPADYLAHRTLGKVAPEAIWQAGWVCSLDLGEPWKVDNIYQFTVLDSIAKPSHIVDITNTLQSKMDAMQAYTSQHTVVAGVLKQVEARARHYGAMIGVQYAEAFVRSQFIPIAVSNPLLMMNGT